MTQKTILDASTGQAASVDLTADEEAAFDIAAAAWAAGALDRAKAETTARIRRDAEETRVRFITPGHGKAQEYQQKVAEIRLFFDDPEPDGETYPMIYAEAAGLGVTAAQAAELIRTAYTAWQTIGAEILRRELAAVAAVQAAETVEAARAAADVDWSLS